MTTLSCNYNLYSDIQRAVGIEVILPQEAGEKFFEHKEKVKFFNARITAEGIVIDKENTFRLLNFSLLCWEIFCKMKMIQYQRKY